MQIKLPRSLHNYMRTQELGKRVPDRLEEESLS